MNTHHTDRRIVHKEIIINATTQKVWEVLTTSTLFQKWLSNDHLTVVTTWHPDSPITITGIWHGTPYNDKGTILQCTPGKILRYTYLSSSSHLPDTSENYSIIEFRLSKEKNHIKLTVTHSNLIAETAYEHANFYWSVAVKRIKKLIENPDKFLEEQFLY